jgi:hypothetical protein
MDTTKLDAVAFAKMGVHRPMSKDDIDAIHPQAVVDKSSGAEQDNDRAAQSLGTSFTPRLLDPLPDNVELLDVATSHRLQVQRVLQSALDHGLDDVMVVGWSDDGPIFFLASDPSIGNAVYRLELAKQRLLSAVPDRWEVEMATTRDAPDDLA